MIIHEEGDLLTHAGLHAIGHQCNCYCVMKSGIAKHIAQRYPQVVKVDKEIDWDKKFGGYAPVRVTGPNGRHMYVINLYGQYDYGKKGQFTDYKALGSALVNAKYFLLSKFDGQQVHFGLPYGIGCGLGGGDWDYVQYMLDKIFGSDEDIVLHIVKKY